MHGAVSREPAWKLAERRVRQKRSRPLLMELERWMRACRIKAINYPLWRWAFLTCFVEDGPVCFSGNAAQRDEPIAVGQRNWTFARSDLGGHRAAVMYTLIVTCCLNDVDPRAWLADVIAHLPGHPARRVDELLSRHWKAAQAQIAVAA